MTAALQEDAHGVAVSSCQGGHLEYFGYLRDRPGSGSAFQPDPGGLAPEQPFPAALNDYPQVLRWLDAEVDESDASRLALSGRAPEAGQRGGRPRVRDEDWLTLRQLTLVRPTLNDRTGARPNHLPLGF